MRQYDLVSSIVLIIISISVCFGSISIGVKTFYAPGPGFVPFLAGVFLGLSSLPTLIKASLEKGSNSDSLRKKVDLGKTIRVLAGLFAYTFLLSPLGYIIATFSLMLFLLKGVENLKWKWAFTTAIIATIVSYIIFDHWLQSMFPKGLIDIEALIRWIY